MYDPDGGEVFLLFVVLPAFVIGAGAYLIGRLRREDHYEAKSRASATIGAAMAIIAMLGIFVVGPLFFLYSCVAR